MKITFTRHCLESEITPDDLPLEAPCPGTVGEGCSFGRKKGTNDFCSTCSGKGYVMTGLGLHVMAFVIRNAEKYRDDLKKAEVERVKLSNRKK